MSDNRPTTFADVLEQVRAILKDEPGTNTIEIMQAIKTERNNLKIYLQQFRRCTPAEFKCLCLARDLPIEGVHAGAKRGPGDTEIAVLTTLEKRGLLERHPDKHLHWRLSEAGKQLMGASDD